MGQENYVAKKFIEVMYTPRLTGDQNMHAFRIHVLGS